MKYNKYIYIYVYRRCMLCVHIYIYIYIYIYLDRRQRTTINLQKRSMRTSGRETIIVIVLSSVGRWVDRWVGGRCVSRRPPSVFDVQSDVSSAGSYISRTRSRCGSSSLEGGVIGGATGVVVGSRRRPTPDAAIGFCRSHCWPDREPSSALLLWPPRGCRSRGKFVDLLITILIIIFLQNSNYQQQRMEALKINLIRSELHSALPRHVTYRHHKKLHRQDKNFTTSLTNSFLITPTIELQLQPNPILALNIFSRNAQDMKRHVQISTSRKIPKKETLNDDQDLRGSQQTYFSYVSDQ